MNQYETGFRPADPALETAINRAARAAPQRGFTDIEEPAPFDLRSLIALARRQKWTILATTVLGVLIGILYVSQVDRQYTATTLLVVDTRNSELLGVAPALNDTLGVNAVVSTEVEIIRSASVLSRAAAQLDVANSPVFDDPPRLNALLSLIGLGAEPREGPQPSWAEMSPEERDEWTRTLGTHIQVSQRGTTNVIAISAISTIPAESARWANAVAQAYIDEQVLSKVAAREQATVLLQERVDNLAAEVQDVEGRIDAFIVDAIDAAGTPEARVMLADLRSQTGALETQRTTLTTLRTALDATDTAALAALVEDQNLGVQREALLGELTVAPAERAAQIQADLAALETEIRTAAADRAAALEAAVAAQQDEVTTLQDELNATIVDQPLPNDALRELVNLQQDAQIQRGLYTASLTQLRTGQQEMGLALPDSRVITTATTPNAPSYPSVRSTLMLALLLAGAAGFGLALVRENLIGGIASVDHLEQVTGLPVVAAVPRIKTPKNEEPDWAIVDQPLSAFAEALRRTRIGIESVDPDQQLKLVVTSAAPGEGKTTIALALARSFARSGRPTILIDADLRHPSVHKHVKHEAEVGLIDYLLRGRAAETAHLFMMQEEATGLHLVLGSEASSVATDSLILSQRFRSVMEYATKEYE
ncbi:MAG: GumC family protein, partial [Bauldia sp.]